MTGYDRGSKGCAEREEESEHLGAGGGGSSTLCIEMIENQDGSRVGGRDCGPGAKIIEK